jgi:hypothetical protein
MKRLSAIILFVSFFLLPLASHAGDCSKRKLYEGTAIIKSAVYLRDNCPTGNRLATLYAGEKVTIREVDEAGEFYLVESSAGTGFLYREFLTDITGGPLPEDQQPQVVYPGSIFPDLPPDHPYYEEIKDVTARGIVQGFDDGLIRADAPVSRAALAKILVEAVVDDSDIESAVLDPKTYSDANTDSWYAPYLQVARERGIMTGDAGKGTIRPGDNVTGGEAAKMIAVAFGIATGEPEEGKKWYDPPMDLLRELDALPFEDNRHVVTRGEMMFMVSTVLNADLTPYRVAVDEASSLGASESSEEE